jgi:signal transduction histidine kinase
LVKSLRARRSGNEFVNVDMTLNTPAGHVIDCLITATYLGRQELGRDVFQAIIKDVSDRKQEENRLRKLNTDLDRRVAVRTAQLLEALEDLGAFSYSVAHDLRSPLKNIVALSDHLHHHAQARQDDEAGAFTERIQKGAQRMIDLVDDMLRFSQTNTRELDRRAVDIHELVASVIDEQVPEDRRSQLVNALPKGATVLADAPMLKVILHNLLSNSLKFTRNQPSPSIRIALGEKEGHDILSVQDNGVGFDAQHKDQVFGVFKRMHKVEQFEGTGVGLAIVSRIVRKHGGEVWADSAIGAGTTIHIALPKAESRSQDPPFVKVA